MTSLTSRAGRAILTLVLLALYTSALAQSTFLEKINKGLETANSVLSGNATTPGAQTLGSTIGSPQPTQAQVEALAKWMSNPAMSPEAKPLWESAKKLAATVSLESSCSPGSGAHVRLGRYAAPGVEPSWAFRSPMRGMSYHPKTQCLTVDRVDSVVVLAKNAIAFRVVYVSDASGESSRAKYKMVKQPDGEWLFDSTLGQ